MREQPPQGPFVTGRLPGRQRGTGDVLRLDGVALPQQRAYQVETQLVVSTSSRRGTGRAAITSSSDCSAAQRPSRSKTTTLAASAH
jgi:hypothetical protein